MLFAAYVSPPAHKLPQTSIPLEPAVLSSLCSWLTLAAVLIVV